MKTVRSKNHRGCMLLDATSMTQLIVVCIRLKATKQQSRCQLPANTTFGLVVRGHYSTVMSAQRHTNEWWIKNTACWVASHPIQNEPWCISMGRNRHGHNKIGRKINFSIRHGLAVWSRPSNVWDEGFALECNTKSRSRTRTGKWRVSASMQALTPTVTLRIRLRHTYVSTPFQRSQNFTNNRCDWEEPLDIATHTQEHGTSWWQTEVVTDLILRFKARVENHAVDTLRLDMWLKFSHTDVVRESSPRIEVWWIRIHSICLVATSLYYCNEYFALSWNLWIHRVYGVTQYRLMLTSRMLRNVILFTRVRKKRQHICMPELTQY